MRVLHAAAEVYPLIKTGGLADVTGALPAALKAHGVDARLLLPGFPAILAGVKPLHPIAEFGPLFGCARVTLRLGMLGDTGVPAYVIDAPWLYDRPGNPYLSDEGREWPDNPQRFALLGWVAAHLAFGELDGTWRPDVLHAHDWHAALSMAWLDHHPARRVRTVYTVHNLAYQGAFPLDLHGELMLPRAWTTHRGLEFHGLGNFMKAGLLWSDAITTVSPRYAQEIRTPEFGCGLDGVLSMRADRLSGILNGVDTAIWDPATDALLPATYDARKPAGKARCRRALQQDFGLETDERATLFAVVSRLTDQKGMDLLLGALPEALTRGAQLALIGTGEPALEQAFRDAAARHPGRVGVRIGYDESVSHRLIAGADAILVPSRFEPCGLTQLYGLRYGTLPVVRRVGGLADTVVDADPESMAAGTATGFTFDEASPQALLDAMSRAIALHRDGPRWKAVMHAAMKADFSWDSAAQSYETLYDGLLAR